MSIEDENEFNAFSQEEFSLIMEKIDEAIHPEYGSAIGLLSDCNDEPIKNAEVRIRDSDGNLYQERPVYYFSEHDIQKDRASSEMGMWLIVNLPIGIWQLEMYGHIDNSVRLLGSAPVHILPNGIYFTNIISGSNLGYYYPPSCF